MDTYTDKRIININSANGTKNNGTFNSNITFNFTSLLSDEPDIINTQISILFAQIPYSFYNINVYNNILKLTLDGSPTIYTIILTRGNYNSTTLITEIINELSLQGITSISITISSITGVLTFSKSSGSFTLLNSSTIFKVLGLDPNLNYTSTSQKLICSYPLNLLGTLKLRIASYKLFTNNFDSSVGGNFNIISTIPIEAGNFGLILYDNLSDTQSLLLNKIINDFDIIILDDDNNLINFNGIDWSITLLLNITRQQPKKSINQFKDIVTPIINPGFNEDNQDNEGNKELNPIYPDDLNEVSLDNDLDILLYNNHYSI